MILCHRDGFRLFVHLVTPVWTSGFFGGLALFAFVVAAAVPWRLRSRLIADDDHHDDRDEQYLRGLLSTFHVDRCCDPAVPVHSRAFWWDYLRCLFVAWMSINLTVFATGQIYNGGFVRRYGPYVLPLIFNYSVSFIRSYVLQPLWSILAKNAADCYDQWRRLERHHLLLFVSTMFVVPWVWAQVI